MGLSRNLVECSMTRGLLLLSLALQRCVLLVRKSRGCLKAEEIKEEGNGDCFQQSQGLAVGSSKDWLLSPVAEELKKSDVQIRMQKVEILSIVSDQIPGNMHALFHLILTLAVRLISGIPAKVCVSAPTRFFCWYISVLRFEQFEQFFLFHTGFAFMIRWMCELIWVQ